MSRHVRDPHAGRLNRYPKGGVPIDQRLRGLPPNTKTNGCTPGCQCERCDPFAVEP